MKPILEQTFFHVSYNYTARLAHVAGLEMHIRALFEMDFTVESHLVMCIWDALTAVDAPLIIFL